MQLLNGLRRWWQVRTGYDDTPFDGESLGWVISLALHVLLIIVVGLMTFYVPGVRPALTLTVPMEEELEETPETAELRVDVAPDPEVGAHGVAGTESAASEAPMLADAAVIPPPEMLALTADRRVDLVDPLQVATGFHLNKLRSIKGVAGYSTNAAAGAIDQITQQILLSLDERATLVVWLFDQSGSLVNQRKEIHDRFDRIYRELGMVHRPDYKKHGDRPLLTSVMAFGQEITLRTPKPTDDLEAIKKAVRGIEMDESGVERVFEAVYRAASQYRVFRRIDSTTGQPARNVMLVVVSDEAGDDQANLDRTVNFCRRFEMPVYVIGVPAPFGRRETQVKWVDPNPKFDQTPRWGVVSQGPESLYCERIKFYFGDNENDVPLDSGFGPFALTRLCYETGGAYYAVHPNRTINGTVRRQDTEDYASYLQQFFDPRVMRRYRPDYVSIQEYHRRLQQSKARQALVAGAQEPWNKAMASPRLRFVRRSEAELSQQLTEAQKMAAYLEQRIEHLYQTLKVGESDREQEETPRWQAGYDLAMGRVLANKVRAGGYNAILAQAKRGMKFQKPENNTWVLRPDESISTGSQLKRLADKAITYLQRVVDQHPDTPWALLAQRELDRPLGWRWEETHTDLTPRPQGNGGTPNNRPPRDDQRQMLTKPKPRRALPKL